MNQILSLLGITSWKPYLSVLLLPPVPLIVLMLVGARLILPRRGLGWTVVLLTAVLTWLSATTGTATLLARALLNMPPALKAERIAQLRAEAQAREPVAIVVLGGGSRRLSPEYGMSNLTPASIERLRYGLWLGRQTGAPVAFAGGIGWSQRADSRPEAEIAQRIAAQEFGQPLRWIETASRDTRENAASMASMLRQQGIRHVVLVTHDYHAPRARRAFEEAAAGAFRVEPAPLGILMQPPTDAFDWMPTTEGFTAVHGVLREAFARLFGA